MGMDRKSLSQTATLLQSHEMKKAIQLHSDKEPGGCFILFGIALDLWSRFSSLINVSCYAVGQHHSQKYCPTFAPTYFSL